MWILDADARTVEVWRPGDAEAPRTRYNPHCIGTNTSTITTTRMVSGTPSRA